MTNGSGGSPRRRVVASTFVTLDGYMVGPDEDMSWVIADFDPQMQADIAEEMSEHSDVFVFGRVTYDIFAAYWPNAVAYAAGDELRPAEGKEDPRIIRTLNESLKVVFSSSLDERVGEYARRPRPAGGRDPAACGTNWQSSQYPGQREHCANARASGPHRRVSPVHPPGASGRRQVTFCPW